MQKMPLFALLFAATYVVTVNARAETSPPRSSSTFIAPYNVEPTPIGPSRDEVADFWTPEKMKAAWTTAGKIPAPPPIDPPLNPDADQSGYTLMPTPYVDHQLSRVDGILFFRVPNEAKEELKHCSASVIHSTTGNLVLTAAHCFRQGNRWHDMTMFVPAYRQEKDGSLEIPLGKWPVQIAYLPYQGAEQTQDDDLAVARVYTEAQTDGDEVTLEQVVGTALLPRVTENNYPPYVKVIGYPGQWMLGDEPYDRAEQRQCDSYTQRNPFSEHALQLLNCAPQGGNSGGPVILENINPDASTVVGVFSAMPGIVARLMPQNFYPIFDAADEEASP